MLDKPLNTTTNLRILRVKMFLAGHSFEEIDRLSIRDFTDVVGYWVGNSKADARNQRKGTRIGRGR